MAAGGRPAVEVHGAKELRRALKKMDGRLKDLKDVHDDVGHLVASRARQIVPYLTGTLEGSIGNDRRQAGASVFAGSRRVPYAGPIHFGWPARNIEAQPFLYEALDDSQDDIERVYILGMEVLIDKLERETPP